MSEDTINVKLSKLIAGPEGEISELKMREPTAADIERCGNPVLIQRMGLDEPTVTFNPKSMSAMIAALSGIAPPFISKLSANDWNSAAWAVSGFFVPIPANVS